MRRKCVQLSLEIEVKAVTCPGVWLCPKGRVSLSVETLGSKFVTAYVPPVFPLHFHELFYFQKDFQNVYDLSKFQSILGNELFFCELIQWPTGCSFENGRFLAKYIGILEDLLYPPAVCKNFIVELLMKSSSIFPGILSPKVEVITKTRIDEVLPGTSSLCRDISLKPDSITTDDRNESKRQMPVCHSPRKRFDDRFNSFNSGISGNHINFIMHNCKLCEICKNYARLFQGIPINQCLTRRSSRIMEFEDIII